jgi:hypothetical protein
VSDTASTPWYFSVATSVVGALASWLIAWVTAKRVALKSTRKQAFLELLEILDNLEAAAHELFLVSGGAPQAPTLFRAVAKWDTRLGRRIQELFTAHWSKARLAGLDPVPPRVTDARIALRKLAVADDLVSAARNACSPTDAKFHELTDCVDRLRAELRSEAEDMNAGDLQP